MKSFNRFIPFLICLLAASCGSGSQPSNQGQGSTQPSLQGSWEVILPNAGPNGEDGYLELTFAQAGNSVSTSQVESFFYGGASQSYFYCYPTDIQTASATLSGTSVSGTVTTCSGTAAFTGTISGSTMYGAYKDTVGTLGSGSFTASKTSPISGTYSGTLTFLDSTT